MNDDRSPMPEPPVFIDNRDGNTLARALRDHLAALDGAGTPPEEVCIASGYFNPQGFQRIAGALGRIPRLRLLLGADPTPEPLRPVRAPADPGEPEFTRRMVRQGLEVLERGLRRERDLLPFDRDQDRAIRDLLAFLRSGRIEVRRYQTHFLHAKAFLFRGAGRGVLAGSANLTLAGLERNRELVLGHFQDPLTSRVEEWFDRLWEEAEPYDLAAIYEPLVAEFPPYLVYLKVLWHLYGDEIDQEARDEGGIPLTAFQHHGVWRVRKIVERYGGALVADGVGLGKTFTAGEIIRIYRERRQRVLLVCPASLRETTWKPFLNRFQLLVECLSYDELANDVQLGGEGRHLQNALDDYALVVVDEAHNYRNPDTPRRAAVLRRLLSGPRRDVLFLTATPVNNSLWDLYHLLRFFLRHDAALSDRGIRSLRARFDAAMAEDPEALDPDLLYPVIDATTVKRTRKFIRTHYANDRIRLPDGRLEPIRFPAPVAKSVKYRLDEMAPGLFERLEEVLAPEDDRPLLRMARYQPERYRRDGVQESGDSALVGLLRTALLKRFESSVEAFRRTLGRLIEEHRRFLEALDRGWVPRREFFREWSGTDDDLDDLLAESEPVEDAGEYDAARLAADVRSDLEVLRELADRVREVDAGRDPKLQALLEVLREIAEEARREALDAEDECQRRKVLVFSAFEDTLDWIEDHLARVVEADPRLAVFRRRIASVSGADARRGLSRDRALHGFAPKSTGARPPDDRDLYDVLLSTDVLAEGVNLQQCRNVVNYDLPWNPMRLVQRHGRVDRIGSPHPKVFLRTFFPDDRLEGLLELEKRVRRKLAQAAASVGVEVSPIEGGARSDRSFSETREEIERLLRENPQIFVDGGTGGAAQTGEEYRQELRRARERLGASFLEELPWRMGSGMRKGRRTGHLFCAVVADRKYLRFVPRDSGGEVIVEVGTCLRMIECTEETPRALSPEMAEGAYDAWEVARRSVFEEWMRETDPANLQPPIRRLNREVAAFLRAHPAPDVEPGRLQRCLESVESPWPRREEQALREVFEQDFPSSAEKVRALVRTVERLGIEPYRAPEPLPPIREEDVRLVAWMALEAETESRTGSGTEGRP